MLDGRALSRLIGVNMGSMERARWGFGETLGGGLVVGRGEVGKGSGVWGHAGEDRYFHNVTKADRNNGKLIACNI